MARKTDRAAVILLVDDDPGDQELTRRALAGGELRVDLRVVSDGEQALDYLNRRGRFACAGDAPFPDLLLLDLNMPRLDGREVLKRIKADPRLRKLPVLVMTTSRQEADIVRSYDLGCNSFVTKPLDVGGFLSAVRELGAYWLELVTLPRGEAHVR